MKKEKEILDRIDLLNDLAETICTPVDPDSVSSVAGAMARKQALKAVIEELEWVLS